MGYYIFSYGVDTLSIKAAFNSKDDKLLEKIKQTDVYENYKDFEPEGYSTTPGKALEDIIYGNEYDEKAGFAYGYAIICITDVLGKKVPYTQEIKFIYETDFINRFLKEDFNISIKIEEELFEHLNPFLVPQTKDWPMIGVLSQKELLLLKEKLQHFDISDNAIEVLQDSEDEDEEEKGYAYEHIKGIIENINFCIDNKLDLISFCH